MSAKLGDGFNFSVGGGVSSNDLLTYGTVICAVVLVVGIFHFIRLEKMRKEMQAEILRLNEKMDAISKTLKDVE